jgi:hypothetical protein
MHSNINSLAQPLADKTAIGLSLLCAIHCLALPVLVVLAPALGSMAIADESFHLWVVAVAIPVSAYALLLGCRKHRHLSVLATGIIGLTVLGVAALAGHDLVGESGERALTLLGAFIIAWSHVRNYYYCRSASRCDSTA